MLNTFRFKTSVLNAPITTNASRMLDIELNKTLGNKIVY